MTIATSTASTIQYPNAKSQGCESVQVSDNPAQATYKMIHFPVLGTERRLTFPHTSLGNTRRKRMSAATSVLNAIPILGFSSLSRKGATTLSPQNSQNQKAIVRAPKPAPV